MGLKGGMIKMGNKNRQGESLTGESPFE